ncbi:unnamed protein product [Cuscuta campestris]|uniref:F-box domain-containing protein n=1 Tax=Cuscuta campestris TaxID=132261 RepID=A0A484M0D3_9ASTE|nr:unnamed protein product [Cuscuta campestris]
MPKKKFVYRPKKKDPAGASCSDPPPPPPPWAELPRDITANILHRLGAEEVLNSAIRVCTSWRSTCKDPSMWRVVDMSKYVSYHDKLEQMCRYIVNLSQGELLDITIEDFGSDELILYIAKRASKLRRLRLVSCHCVSNESLSEAATQLPSLQDLEIHLSDLSAECIKTIGRSCPLLKSFTYNKSEFPTASSDNEAIAVAENMQGLHHLSLLGNTMTMKGVQAILDGCPHLESLDLRRCFHVILAQDLGGSCKQIKDLKHPMDPICDYEFSNYIDEYGDDYDAFSDGYPVDFFDYYGDDDFEYDDYTDPFRPEYLDDFYSDVPLEWLM